jgi:integrase/recombinase XerC
MNSRIEGFVETLSAEKGFSDHTCRAYRKDLEQFSSYLRVQRQGKTEPDIREVDDLIIRSYLGFLHKKYEKTTIARKLSALRSFFRFLMKRGAIERNPAETVLTPKRGRPVPKYLSVDETFRLLDGVKGESVLALRNRAILEMLYSAGLRVGELVAMTWISKGPGSGWWARGIRSACRLWATMRCVACEAIWTRGAPARQCVTGLVKPCF